MTEIEKKFDNLCLNGNQIQNEKETTLSLSTGAPTSRNMSQSSEVDLKNEISKLNNAELMQKMRDNGLPVGPINAGTRALFEKKLLRHLGINVTNKEKSDIADNDKFVAPSDKENTDQVQSSGNGGKNVESSIVKFVPSVFFAVQLPENINEKVELVYTDKAEMVKVLKKYPGSRFKPFPNEDAARQFIKENPVSTPIVLKSTAKVPNESSPYRSLRPQELVSLRKCIENSDIEKVKQIVNENPRSLISSGDAPTVLQEGFRYNAIHVCAQKNKPEICRYILDTMKNPNFLKKLYPEDVDSTRSSRISFIIDLYLNMPDKGNYESPLHFACKFGNEEMVKVLTSYSGLKKDHVNKHGEKPRDAICQRCKNPSNALKERIACLLEDHVYIPLVGPADNSGQPKIGTVLSPEQIRNMTCGESSPIRHNIPNSPKELPVMMKAYVGPMSPKQAEKFKCNWSTSPSKTMSDRKKYAQIKRSDSEKGFERIGRELAHELNIPWNEYWDFLNSFIDLSTPEGLQKLNAYLKNQCEVVKAQQAIDSNLQDLEQKFGTLKLTSPNSDIMPSTSNQNIFSNPFSLTKKDNCDLSEKSVNDIKVNLFASKKLDMCDTNSDNKEKSNSLDQNSLPSNTNSDKNNQNVLEYYENINNTNKTFSNIQQNNSEVDRERRISSGSGSSNSTFFTALDDVTVDEVELDTVDNSQNMSRLSDDHTPYFVYGDTPTKADIDVLRAVDLVPVSPIDYPHVAKWRETLLSYSETTRNSWSTPLRQRGCVSSPRRKVSNTVAGTSLGFTSPLLETNVSDISVSSADESETNVRVNLVHSFLSV